VSAHNSNSAHSISLLSSSIVGSSWNPITNSHLLHHKTSREAIPSYPKVLACSSDAMIVDNKRFYRRWIRWFQRWWAKIWNLTLVAARTTEVGIRLSPLLILSPVAALSGSSFLTDVTWQYLVSAVQGIGPVAVKFAQWIATRRDVFPPVLCDRLGVLHDRGCPHARSHTNQILKDAFGDYQAKGLHIEEGDVIGCGSAAQVYRGTLSTKDDNGKEVQRAVAIKVLHPKFQQQVSRDLKLIQIIAEALHSLPTDIIRMMNLPRATETFGYVLFLQADLINEAKNLNQFRSNFYRESKARQDESSIVFPQPIQGWSSPKVIVEDYVHDAIPISDFIRDSSAEGIAIRKELAGPLLRAFLKMVFIDNFVSPVRVANIPFYLKSKLTFHCCCTGAR
jgi:aarF domain-containing kinase